MILLLLHLLANDSILLPQWRQAHLSVLKVF